MTKSGLEQDENVVMFKAIDPEMNRVLYVLATTRFRVSDSPQTSREINYYEEKGLLLSTRENTNEWRKFDANELVWLHIIEELRTFGYPLEKIKKIRDGMVVNKTQGTIDKRGVYTSKELEFIIAMSIVAKREFFFIVFPDGTNSSYYDDLSTHLWESPTSYMRKSHISIPLGPTIKRIWESIPKEEKVEFVLPQLLEVDRSEKEIIQDIRSRKYERVTVHFKNKKPEMLTLFERKEIRRIEDILRESKFQKVELIQANGEVVSIVREIKKKLQ